MMLNSALIYAQKRKREWSLSLISRTSGCSYKHPSMKANYFVEKVFEMVLRKILKKSELVAFTVKRISNTSACYIRFLDNIVNICIIFYF